MTGVNPSTTLVSYITESRVLYPEPPRFKVLRSKKALRLQQKLAKLYWEKKQPNMYLRTLCSHLTLLLGSGDAKITHLDTLMAESTASQFTEKINKIYRYIAAKRNIFELMGGNPTLMSVKDWSGLSQYGKHVELHVSFIWNLVTAIDDPNIVVSSEEEISMLEIKKSVPKWTLYIESLFNLYAKD